jgi:hypothetical protein
MDYKNILKIRGLKYWVAVVVFLCVIFIFDQNTLPEVFQLRHEVSELDDSIASLEASIARDSAYNASLVDNPDQLEILGRVNYYMKRDNEDIFVIKDNKK